MKVSIETYGCAANHADGEAMAGVLEARGHEIVGEGGDVVVVNTCTVKTPTERRMRRRLRGLAGAGARVVVAGCMPAAQPDLVDEFPSFSFIGVNSGDIAAAVSAAGLGERYVSIEEASGKESLPSVRSNPVVLILPVSEGCLGACSYCITRLARRGLRSYRMGVLVQRVEEAASHGVKEIWVTSQDTGAYGMDFGGSLPQLLCAVAGVSGDFRVRVGMMNPHHALGMLDELTGAFKNEKIYGFAHVPVQSGDDGVLSDMGRPYSVDDFIEVVSAFRRKLDATVSTDVICGYPTESESAFENTMELIKKVEPDVLNVSRFWPRPGTAAAGLPQLPGRVTKDRSRRAGRLFEEVGLARNGRWVGWRGRALVSEENPDGSFTARNQQYKPIIVKAGRRLLGRWIDVEIKEATHYDLRGKIIE